LGATFLTLEPLYPPGAASEQGLFFLVNEGMQLWFGNFTGTFIKKCHRSSSNFIIKFPFSVYLEMGLSL
jgi:hypothetical protein